jgi:N-acetylmuramoyl-L-alanine amidase
MVLVGATMPSVLAEISFLTNPQEAALLADGDYRQEIARALLDGIMLYQKSLKTGQTVASQN